HCPHMMNERLAPRVACVWIASTAIALGGCRKESDRPKWDIDALVPIARTTLTLRDLVADSLIQTAPDGSVTLVYRGTLFEVGLDSLLPSPDTSFVYRYALPIPGPINLPPGINFFNQTDVQRFDLGDLALSRLDLHEGRLELRMTNMVQSRILGTIQIPGATFADGGNSLSTAADAGSPAQPRISLGTRDLAGARFDLRGPQLNSVNTLLTVIGAQLDPDGQGATVTDQDSLFLEARYFGLVPAYARGFFGQRTTSEGPATQPLGLFDAVVDGILDLDVATLRLRVENGFGADLQLRLHELTAINSRTGAEVPLQHALLQGPLNLTRALDLGSGPQRTVAERELDPGNSNLVSFIEALPDQARYHVDLALNPLGDISNGNDFLYHESAVKATIDLEVPLRLIADELTLQTIARPELPGSANGHALRSGTLRLFATNGFPMRARLMLDLIDQSDAVVATIPVQGSILAAAIDTGGLVTQPSTSRLTAVLDEALVDLLYSGTRLRTRVAFTTAAPPRHLRLLDSYALDLQLTLEANYMVNGDE
ncbi:MAG: hypothetical protein ACK4L7_06095, partial [Flavobacteriales bacterium]